MTLPYASLMLRGRRKAEWMPTEAQEQTHSKIQQVDMVLLQQPKHNKLSTRYEQEPYIVVDRKGNSVVLHRDGRQINLTIF